MRRVSLADCIIMRCFACSLMLTHAHSCSLMLTGLRRDSALRCRRFRTRSYRRIRAHQVARSKRYSRDYGLPAPLSGMRSISGPAISVLTCRYPDRLLGSASGAADVRPLPFRTSPTGYWHRSRLDEARLARLGRQALPCAACQRSDAARQSRSASAADPEQAKYPPNLYSEGARERWYSVRTIGARTAAAG
jgi:hypothetical protein